MKRQKSMPIREVVDEKIYLDLLNKPKSEKQQQLHYYRFKVFLVIARHTGLRASDIGGLTRDKINDLLEKGQLNTNETKTGKSRIVLFSEKARSELLRFKDRIHLIFEKQDTLMGPKHTKNFIRFINSHLKEASNGEGLRSHSLRATYITHLLKHYSIHEVRKIVNHSSVSITGRYFRYHANSENLQEVLSLLSFYKRVFKDTFIYFFKNFF